MAIENEDALSRIATNLALIAGAISTLAEAVNGTYKGKPIYADTPVAAQPANSAPSFTEPAPAKRGRGRPAKGEETPPAAPVASPAATEVDPFAPPAPGTPSVPAATIEQVRAALTALKEAASQDIALMVLKVAGGANNLTELKPDKYGLVVAAVEAKKAEYQKPATPTPVEADPFDIPAATAAAKPLTFEDVKLVIVETGKRASQDTIQKVVMAHGGKAPVPTGGEGPSLRALPEAQFAATIAALKALPTTK